MWAFTLILAAIILSTAIVFYGFNRSVPFDRHIVETYTLIYGAFDFSTYTDTSQRILVSVTLFLLSVVLLNLLVSIMGHTFANFQENRIFTKSRTQIYMILKSMLFLRFFKSKRQAKKEYLMSCGPKNIEKDTVLNEIEHNIEESQKTEKRVIQLEEEVRQLKSTINQNQEQLMQALYNLQSKSK